MRGAPARPGKTVAVVLAIGVHMALALFLIFGVHWQNRHPETMMVELVPPSAAEVVRSPQPALPPPEPRPAPPVPPPPAKVEARPEPQQPPQPTKADIALKTKQEKEKLEKQRAEKERELQDQAKREQDKLTREQRERELRELAKTETNKREREVKELARREIDKRALQETKLAQDRAQQETEERRKRDELARVERDQREQRAKVEAQQAAAKAATSKAFADYINRIQAKVRGNVVLPPDIVGNPEAVFEVVQLPTGEIISAELRKSSGSRAYDDAVSRAILKSSPLPKPDTPDQLERIMVLKFRPQS